MTDLFIQRHGHGPQHLVLLHGWAMHGGLFAPLTQALADAVTVHVVDLPGHGYSRDCQVPLEPTACAAAIAEATPPAVWLGWSLGGLVALTGATQHADQIQGLAMMCATPRFAAGPDWSYGMSPDVVTGLERELDSDYRATLERFLQLEAMGSQHARDDMQRMRADLFARGEPDPRVLREGLQILEQTDLRPQLQRVCAPNVWLAGARDRLVPWQSMRWSAEQAGGEFTCIEHAGHAPFIGFTDTVVESLRPLWNASQPERASA